MRAKLNLDSTEKIGLNKDVIYKNIGYTSHAETKQRKNELMRGAKDLIKGIPAANIFSSYQENYRFYF